jgi:hypothetical protein
VTVPALADIAGPDLELSRLMRSMLPPAVEQVEWQSYVGVRPMQPMLALADGVRFVSSDFERLTDS